MLASTSLAALLIGVGTPGAFAQCNFNFVNNVPPPPANVTNPSGVIGPNINCTSISNGTTIAGSVTNTQNGVITTGFFPTANGIAINNSSIGGAIVNAGQITSRGFGILIVNNATVSGGISNSGTITISTNNVGILVEDSALAGGISNSGTVTISANNIGILVSGVSNFSGSFSNSGTISSGNHGIQVVSVSTFAGGISNSGTIISAFNDGIAVGQRVTTFAGGISNSGTISGNRALKPLKLANEGDRFPVSLVGGHQCQQSSQLLAAKAARCRRFLQQGAVRCVHCW